MKASFSFSLPKTAGKTFIKCGLEVIGVEAISIRRVSLALFSNADSEFRIMGFTTFGSKGGIAEEIAGPALTR